MKKRPLIVLTGPTAVGKTALSVKLAKAVNGEIISADSMQVYKGMDIGSAKISKEEMEGIPHHLIDVLDPSEEFNIVKFKELSLKAMEEIYAKGKIPIIAGGTGFYIQSVLYDIAFENNEDERTYRNELENIAKEPDGTLKLFQMLKECDPKSAEIIHQNNVKRVIRALEFFKETGLPISEHNEEQKQNESPYNFCYFVLNDDRDKLYENIEKRVDIMLENGLLDEVKTLHEKGYTKDMVSMQGLGYKEILEYFNGEISLERAVYLIKRDTRHFAKRQLTWFRREKEISWVNKQDFSYDEEKILKHILDKLKENAIL